MARLNVVEDLGAPLLVTLIDLSIEAGAPDKNEIASYIVAGGGYLGSAMGWGGPFLKNSGIASLPWAAKNIYERIRGISGVGETARNASLSMKSRVSRYPAPPTKSPFNAARLA